MSMFLLLQNWLLLEIDIITFSLSHMDLLDFLWLVCFQGGDHKTTSYDSFHQVILQWNYLRQLYLLQVSRRQTIGDLVQDISFVEPLLLRGWQLSFNTVLSIVMVNQVNLVCSPCNIKWPSGVAWWIPVSRYCIHWFSYKEIQGKTCYGGDFVIGWQHQDLQLTPLKNGLYQLWMCWSNNFFT